MKRILISSKSKRCHLHHQPRIHYPPVRMIHFLNLFLRLVQLPNRRRTPCLLCWSRASQVQVLRPPQHFPLYTHTKSSDIYRSILGNGVPSLHPRLKMPPSLPPRGRKRSKQSTISMLQRRAPKQTTRTRRRTTLVVNLGKGGAEKVRTDTK